MDCKLRPKDRFLAYEEGAKRPGRSAPFIVKKVTTCSVDALDSQGCVRIFDFATWRFEKLKNVRKKKTTRGGAAVSPRGS